jgi:hypothetical protein
VCVSSSCCLLVGNKQPAGGDKLATGLNSEIPKCVLNFKNTFLGFFGIVGRFFYIVVVEF